jgi:hypothetical protein
VRLTPSLDVHQPSTLPAVGAHDQTGPVLGLTSTIDDRGTLRERQPPTPSSVDVVVG